MLRNSKLFALFTLYLAFVFLWWVKIQLTGGAEASDTERYLFNLSYGFSGLLGGISGFIIAKKWGLKSLIGKAILMLSLGLFSEWIANLIWGYYNLTLRVEIPYPSEADIFFFAIIPLYALAMFYLAKATKASISLKNFKNTAVAVLVPILMLILAYTAFLSYGLDTSDPVRLFFDLGYPLGEVVTFSIAILTFYLTKDYLGGIMRKPVLGVIGAYLLQFTADYGFLYTALNETYYNANWVDLFYGLAMIAMAIAIINFDVTLSQIKAQLGIVAKEEVTTNIEEKNLHLYQKIITQIIKDQEEVIGPLALMQANDVTGLYIETNYSDVKISRNPNEVIGDLAKKYEALFGKTAVEVMKESTSKVLKFEPDIDPTFTLNL